MTTCDSPKSVNAVITASLAIILWFSTPGSALPQSGSAWSGTSTGVGIGLIYGPKSGSPEFSLACVRGTREVLAIAYKVRPEAGRQEAALTIGARRFGFIVKPEAIKDGKMLQASAKAGPELLAAIRSGEPMRFSYGGAPIGSYPSLPADLARPFAERCGPLV